MITYMPVLIALFYTHKFTSSIQILQWQLMGDFLRILIWPISFVILAKAKGVLYVISESLWYILYYALLYFSWDYIGLQSLGMSFFLAYVMLISIMLVIAHSVSGYRWSRRNLIYVLSYFSLVVLAFLNARYVPQLMSYGTGAVLVMLSAVLSYYGLKQVIDIKALFRKFIR